MGGCRERIVFTEMGPSMWGAEIVKHVVCICRVLYGLMVARLALEQVGGTGYRIKAFEAFLSLRSNDQRSRS